MANFMKDIFVGFFAAVFTVILAATLFVGYFVTFKNGEFRTLDVDRNGYIDVMTTRGIEDASWVAWQKLNDRGEYHCHIGEKMYYLTYDK